MPRGADVIEQRRLAMIHVPHYRDNRCPGFELEFSGLRGLGEIRVRLIELGAYRFMSHFLGQCGSGDRLRYGNLVHDRLGGCRERMRSRLALFLVRGVAVLALAPTEAARHVAARLDAAALGGLVPPG